jgi:hypothetical protein
MPSGPAGVGPSSRNELKVAVAGPHVEQAEAIGPAQPDAAVARDLSDALLHRAAVGADLGKAGGEHDDALDALRDASPSI